MLIKTILHMAGWFFYTLHFYIYTISKKIAEIVFFPYIRDNIHT
jgi:hypothetical protein